MFSENAEEEQGQMNEEESSDKEDTSKESKTESSRPSYKALFEEQKTTNEELSSRLAELEKADKEAKNKRMEEEGDFKGIIEDLNKQILGTTEKLTEAQTFAKEEAQKSDFFKAAYEGGVRTDALEDAFKLASMEDGIDMKDVVATLLDEKPFLKKEAGKTAPSLDVGNKDVPDGPKESYQEKRDRIFGSQSDGVWNNPEEYGGGVVQINGQ